MCRTSWDAPVLLPAIMIHQPLRTMVLASKMTNVVFAAAMALRMAHAIATETHWMHWVNAEGRARPMSTRMAFAMISSNRVARILRLATTRVTQ